MEEQRRLRRPARKEMPFRSPAKSAREDPRAGRQSGLLLAHGWAPQLQNDGSCRETTRPSRLSDAMQAKMRRFMERQNTPLRSGMRTPS
jgi:hypothetical protein